MCERCASIIIMPIFDFENVFFIRSHHRLPYVRRRHHQCWWGRRVRSSGQEWSSHQYIYLQTITKSSIVLYILLAIHVFAVREQSLARAIQKRERSILTEAALNNGRDSGLSECTVACIISKIQGIYFDFEHLLNFEGVRGNGGFRGWRW